MADVYDQQLKYAQSLGFKTPALAIQNLGKAFFLEQFSRFNIKETHEGLIERVKVDLKKNLIPIEKVKKVRKALILSREKAEQKKIKMLEGLLYEGGKPLLVDENYIIFPDGRLFSILSYKFVKPIEQKDRRGQIYFNYSLRGKQCYMMSRLVYFHFGKHRKQSYQDIKRITYLDNNPANCHISNLQECTQMDINRKFGKNVIGAGNSIFAENLAKIKVTEKETISEMLTNGFTNKAIAKKYNVSEKSIGRYIKRHQLTKKHKSC